MKIDSQFDRRTLIMASLQAVALVLLCGSLGIYILSAPDLRLVHEFALTAKQIESNYTENLDSDRLIEAAREGMFDRLDRYSMYFNPDRMARMREELSGGYSGIGVTVAAYERGLMIVSVHSGGPADSAGLRLGDIIIEADGVPLDENAPSELIDQLRGPEGDTILVKILRLAHNDTLALSLARRTVRLQHLSYAGSTDNNVLYARLDDFEAGASEDLRTAIDSLMNQPERKPVGLVLDLRGNPGGQLLEAYLTADLFVPEDRFIVGTDGRSKWRDDKYYSSGPDISDGLPMVVLVDGQSASAAEIVAGALRQLGRAALVGDTTFGKGLVQGYAGFSDGSGMRLTESRYYLEGNLYLNEFDSTFSEIGSGLIPDYEMTFVSDQLFPRRLENSLLLFEFAAIIDDSLKNISADISITDQIVDQFAAYTAGRGFIYVSTSTREAENLVDLTTANESSDRMASAARQLLYLAQKDDIDQFAVYSDYIKYRLAELICQRRNGKTEAWADIVVKQRPDILYAANLVMEAGR